MAPSSPNFPSLEDCMNLLRAICNDSFAGATDTPGEGQILTDQVPGTSTNNPFTLNLLNSSIRELYRKLMNVKDEVLIQDNYLVTGLNVIDGPLGSGVTDPTIQTYLDYTGYWTGQAYQTGAGILLPSDMLFPLRVWERASGTTDTFSPITRITNGLPPRDQTTYFSQWEWRYERINFCGATSQRDIRIRYACLLPTFFDPELDYSTTYIPVIGCQDFVAYRSAEKVALSLGNPSISAALKATADGHLFDLRNQRVRQQQHANYRRPAFQDVDASTALDVYGI